MIVTPPTPPFEFVGYAPNGDPQFGLERDGRPPVSLIVGRKPWIEGIPVLFSASVLEARRRPPADDEAETLLRLLGVPGAIEVARSPETAFYALERLPSSVEAALRAILEESAKLPAGGGV